MAMRSVINLCRRAFFLSFLLVFQVHILEAADKTAASLLVKDSLAAPGQIATIEAKLAATSRFMEEGLGGEPVELVLDGKVTATGMTGGDGQSRLAYGTKRQGTIPVQVRVGNSPRVSPAEGWANLMVWERRSPIVAIEMASLMEKPSSSGPFPAMSFDMKLDQKPTPDAADELAKLAQFYYRLIYVVALPAAAANGFRANAVARQWLETHRFPPGYVLVLPFGESALGKKIDELHAAGWKNLKTGIGRSKVFAEVFLQHRLEAIIVPEPDNGAVPRKAQAAKNWKEVRKKL